MLSDEKCDVNEQDQIALHGETLTGNNNEGCPNETKHESSEKSSNNGNTTNYEELGDNLGDHHYTLTPPNMEAIYEEMEEEGVTVEQVIEISRANDDDDDDDDTEDPVTDYV